MNELLALALRSIVAQNAIGCMAPIADRADVPSRTWKAGVLYDVTTKTLLYGDHSLSRPWSGRHRPAAGGARGQ